ncbi:MAG: ATP-binding protein [Pseudoflavonifractor sp.]
MGIYLGFDLLLTVIFCGGMFVWSERQCGEISALVQTRGVPTAEASQWMQAGDYTVTAGETARGTPLPDWLPAPEGTEQGTRYFNPGYFDLFFLAHFTTEGPTAFALEMPNGGAPYTIALDLSHQIRFFTVTSRVLAVVQLLSLISNLFKNAGTIKRTLRPIQDLATTAAKLGNVSTMSPEELQLLAVKLNEINATHLDTRISVSGTQRELKTLAEAINAMLDRINEAYSSQMRFVSDASHELRTPIAVIQGYASMLNRWGKDDPATRQEAIDAITSESAAMKELIEQLLFLARGDNDSMHVEFETVDLTAVAAEVLRETEMIDRTHPFSAKWDGCVCVRADVGLIKQTMRILVDNSIKYTPPGGHIRLSVTGQDGTARLSVQDEGQGIDPEALPHIFDRFYRTDQSRARQTGGTGLGLAIAKWIVDRHGGWFEVTSRPGIGTRITVAIPLVEGSAEEKQDEKPA